MHKQPPSCTSCHRHAQAVQASYAQAATKAQAVVSSPCTSGSGGATCVCGGGSKRCAYEPRICTLSRSSVSAWERGWTKQARPVYMYVCILYNMYLHVLRWHPLCRLQHGWHPPLPRTIPFPPMSPSPPLSSCLPLRHVQVGILPPICRQPFMCRRRRACASHARFSGYPSLPVHLPGRVDQTAIDPIYVCCILCNMCCPPVPPCPSMPFLSSPSLTPMYRQCPSHA
jgi:hypothetical protein